MIDESKFQGWRNRLDLAQAGHYRQCEVYAVLNLLFGFPLVVLSSFVSTALFIDPSTGPTAQLIDHYAKGAGVAVVVFSAIQAFVRPAEKAEQHRSKAAKYGSLKRRLEFFTARSTQISDTEENFLRDLESSWDAIAEDSPTTAWWVRQTLNLVPPNSPAQNGPEAKSSTHSTR